MYTLGRAILIVSIIIAIIMGASALALSTRKPEPVIIREVHSMEYQAALFQASRVYGKAGCGDQNLAEMTARNAIATKLPASIIAAQIAIESSCNPLAISNKGAIGLTQITVKVWASQYRNFQDVNLFNEEDSMRVGTTILSNLVRLYGLRNGLRRYNGAGEDAELYAERIVRLAGEK